MKVAFKHKCMCCLASCYGQLTIQLGQQTENTLEYLLFHLVTSSSMSLVQQAFLLKKKKGPIVTKVNSTRQQQFGLPGRGPPERQNYMVI